MFCYCRLEWSVKVSYANWLITLFKFSIIADFMSIVCMKVKVPQSCPTLSDPMVYTVHGVDSHPLLQGIFPTQGLNPGLRHCRQILYQLSHQGSPLFVWTEKLLLKSMTIIVYFSIFLIILLDFISCLLKYCY